MGPKKLKRMLGTIAGKLDSRRTPYALIDGFALNMYGIPRYTADLVFMAEQSDREKITANLAKAGFDCRNETEVFARFESEVDFFGRVECMFVRTRDGRDMLDHRMTATDSEIGTLPVVQPTDYIILKLMAIANQPEGSVEDEADIRSVLECYKLNQIPAWCGALDRGRIELFAERFGQKSTVVKLFQAVFEPPAPRRVFAL